MLGDGQLVSHILTGQTKFPITRENWLRFVESTYTTESTFLYLEILKFTQVYRDECIKIALNPNIDEDVLTLQAIDGMMDYTCSISNEMELKQWSEKICSGIIDQYVKVGAKNEVNLGSKIREDCVVAFKDGKYHPSIFKEVKHSILNTIVENDLPKFRAIALDTNLEIEHRKIRLYVGLAFGAFSIVLYTLLLAYQTSQYYRLLGLPLLFLCFIGFFQWKAKFCVQFAKQKQKNVQGYSGLQDVEDDYACQYQSKRAYKINRNAWLSTLTCAIILFVVPPYNW